MKIPNRKPTEKNDPKKWPWVICFGLPSDKKLTNDLCTKYEPNRMKNGQVSPFWNFFSKIEIWLVGPVCMGEIGSRIRIQSTWSWQVSMQKINLIAQSVLELSHRENCGQRQRQRQRRRRRRRHPPGLNYSPRRKVFRRGQKRKEKRKEKRKKTQKEKQKTKKKNLSDL